MAYRSLLLALSMLFVPVGLVAKVDACANCGMPVCDEPEYVECTVMVPTTVSKTRVYKQTLLRPEQRERPVITYKYVPTTREVTCQKLVMTPRTLKRTKVYYECVPVTREIVNKCTVEVPYIKDVIREYEVCGELRTCVEKVSACRLEEREYKSEVTVYESVQRARDVEITQLVAKTKRTKRAIEVLECVPVETTQMCTVMVPYVAERPVEIRRCVLVPKQVRVPVCSGCGCRL